MTPNQIVEIKPTKSGWEQITRYVEKWNAERQAAHQHAPFRKQVPVPDQEGYIRGYFYMLMGCFDWNVQLGAELPFHDLRIPKTHNFRTDNLYP